LLGRAYAQLGRREEASSHLHRALAIAERHHDRTQQAVTHLKLAWFRGQLGDPFSEQPSEHNRQALDHAGKSLELFRAIGNPVGEAYALDHMALLVARLGNLDLARGHCDAALALFRTHNEPMGQASSSESMGYIDHHDGHHSRAIGHYRHALALLAELGNTGDAAHMLDQLGDPYLALGQRERARVVWREALELYRQQGRVEELNRVQWRLDGLDRHEPAPALAHEQACGLR
jgi:tetratricopeptide (TPR) repeat protein